MKAQSYIAEKCSTAIESALYKITELAISTESMEDYYSKIHQVIAELTYAENFYIILFDEKKEHYKFVYYIDEEDTDTLDDLEVISLLDDRVTLTTYLLKSKRMLHVSVKDVDVLIEKGEVEIWLGEAAHDWLGIPLQYQDELLGAMVIQSYDNDISYGQREEQVLQFVAQQITLLFKYKLAEHKLVDANLLLERRVTERTYSLEQTNKAMLLEIEERKKGEKIQAALFKITDLVSTTRSLDEFYKSVHSVISNLMYAKNCYVALLSENNQHVEFVYYADQLDPIPKSRPMTKNASNLGLTEQILLKGDVIIFNRTDKDKKALSGSDCSSYLGVPLKDEESTFGVLAIQSYHKDIRYTEKDQSILMTTGKQIATAILRKKDSDSLIAAHETLEHRVKERTSELETTITKRKKIELQLEHDSLHDALSGLPNRLHFSNLLDSKVAEQDSSFAVLFLDLDRFKLINDSLGHHVGDLFLIEVAGRLSSCLRQNDVVARLGGDEFCILMNDLKSKETAIKLASRILNELKKPMVVNNHSLITSASIGIRFAENTQATADEIMGDADVAMYQAKHQGKNRFCLFDSGIKQLVSERMRIENDLRNAISKDGLFIHYQPIIDLTSNKTVGCEALIRWNHPTRGLIGPDIFIPIAEETGIIIDIGEFVLNQAIETLIRFAKIDKTKNYFVNINISAMQILSQNFDSYLKELLLKSSINPSLLNLEITESILIEDYKAAQNFVKELKSMGIKVYLDDFGTGYSSLGFLHQFPFNVIKLDKSFIQAMDSDDRNLAIVESIASMANNLKMEILADGIETQEQLNRVSAFEYQYGQGNYFSKPVDLESLIEQA